MSPRSLFSIILKVVGIFFIKNILISVANIIPALSQIKKDDFRDYTILSLVILVLEGVVYLLLTYLLLFKTNWVIDKLKLNQGFQEDTFNFNIHRSNILRIAIIILGSLIIIDAIPSIVQQLLYFIEMRKDKLANANINFAIFPTVKLFIGIFLIVYQRTLVNFIEYKQRRKNSA